MRNAMKLALFKLALVCSLLVMVLAGCPRP